MYRCSKATQLDLFTIQAPIMEVLDLEDPIIKLADSLDWDYIEEVYAKNMNSDKPNGRPAKYSARVAFGALLVKQMNGCSDRDTV